MRNLLLTLPLLASFLFLAAQGFAENNNNNYEDYDAVTVFDSTTVDVQPSGLSYVNIHKLIKINTVKGAKQNHTVRFDYDPLSAFVRIDEAIIHRATGETEKIDTSLVKDYPAAARMIYWGARKKMIPVGRLNPGDKIEVKMFRKGFTYALLQQEDDRYVPPMRGHYYDIVEFWSDQPIKEKVYQVYAPKEKPLQYEFYNGEVGVSSRFIDSQIVYTFTKKDIFPIQREPHMVALTNIAPKLLLTTSPDWEAKSVWFYNVNEDYGSFETTPEITQKTKEILEGADSELDSISRLTHWVADEIRYSGISMGEGEGYTLHKGETIFRDRIGVCKDKAGMLITMLRAAGFESYAAMTMAGSRIEDIPADQFNHSITVVKMSDGSWKILDPTWVPFVRELWSSAEQQQNYLLGLPEGSDLKKTPVSDPENHYFNLTLNTTLNSNGTLSGTLHLEAEGQSDAAIRGFFTRNPVSKWYAYVERQITGVDPAAKIKSLDYGDPYDYSNPIQINIEFEIPHYATQANGKLYVNPLSTQPLFMAANYHRNFSGNIKERKYAFKDRCSRLVTIKETMQLPANISTAKVPDDAEGRSSAADYNLSYQQKNNTLVMSQRLSFKKRVYKASEWPGYKNAIMAQKKFENKPVIITLK
ncbi:MAG: DUF3857 and transglutaminase domain-containing protein [Bacteroidales bacterium]|nr:DUF3857 and transglutaminase domain-containing protein [Bacteroidales bacterium]